MALNFLKRKKHSRKRVRLICNPFRKNKSKHESAEYLEKVFSISLKEPPQGLPTGLKQDEAKESPESPNDFDNMLPEKDASEQNWDKGKERIEKLMNEIYNLLASDDYTRKRFRKMTESHSDKENNPKQQDLNEKSVTDPSSSEQNKNQKNGASKPPLDIQELHSVAAMAKRLSERSKLKNHSIKNEQ